MTYHSSVLNCFCALVYSKWEYLPEPAWTGLFFPQQWTTVHLLRNEACHRAWLVNLLSTQVFVTDLVLQNTNVQVCPGTDTLPTGGFMALRSTIKLHHLEASYTEKCQRVQIKSPRFCKARPCFGERSFPCAIMEKKSWEMRWIWKFHKRQKMLRTRE